MSSGTRNLAPSLLVVSNRVYAKAGDDGVFYSGSIESKLEENSYVVRFADDKKRVVREQDLVWLSFYGLPSSWWPENPVVEPIIYSDDTFEGTLQFVGDRTKAPASFTVRRSNEDEKSNSLRGGDHRPGAGKLLLGDRDKHTQGPPCGRFPEEQGVKQARSSVLRLNRDLLHEESWNNDYHHSSRVSLNETMNLIPGYMSGKNPEPQIQHKYSVKVAPMHRGGPCYSPKAMYKTGGLTGRETRDWGDEFAVNQSSFAPPITPCVSADCNSPWRRRLAGAICESVPRGESTIPAWGMENTQLLKKGHAKKRKKRSETRKCRKVYGIDHREAWCIPCRWKKACTRFQECEEKN